ncbi:MAG: sensor histidine kinase [Gemmatimonadaceae bacterium]
MRPSRATRRLAGRMVIPTALFLPIAIVIVLLYYHQQTENARRKTLGRATHVYSSVAAWQFARLASGALHKSGDSAIHQIGRVMGGVIQMRAADQNTVHFPVDTTSPEHPAIGRARGVFRADVGTGELIAYGADYATPEGRAALERRISRIAPIVHDPHLIRFHRMGDTVVATVYGVISNRDDRVRVVYGIETDAQVFRSSLERIVDSQPLLPMALFSRPLGAHRVRISLSDPEWGRLIVLGNASGNTVAATDTLETNRGGLHATVELDSTLVSTLLLSSPSRAPFPFIAGLLFSALCLAALALLQLRKVRLLAEMRGQFVANVSHELRTPLTHISLFAETLLFHRERSVAERDRYATIIQREAQRLKHLVETVLSFSRSEAGRVDLKPAAVDLGAEVRDAVESLRPIVVGASVRLDHDVRAAVAIYADPAAVRQIVVNLLDNAVKYGPRGQRIVVGVDREGSSALLTVADEGPGIPFPDRERVFEPFVRLPARGARIAGTGIGLSVVRDLVNRHLGTVTIAEAPQGGTEVRVLIPALDSAMSADVPATERDHHVAI